jgi:protein KTI12
MRYEEPDSFKRWDTPLFTVTYLDNGPDIDGIWNAIVNANVKPPNMATVAV